MAQGNLRNLNVFLSASVPDESQPLFSRIPDAAYQIEQAVVSLVRSVFNAGGQLVFGGHPSVTPLVAAIATEYPRTEQTRVSIYQSHAFDRVITDDTKLLRDLGFARLTWTEAVDDEEFIPGEGAASYQCPKSLLQMRETLITIEKPIAMVCIGGMQGVLDEAHLFSKKDQRSVRMASDIYTFTSTGGAAHLLATEKSPVEGYINIPDKNFYSASLREDRSAKPIEDAFNIIPFPYIMQRLVADIGAACSESGNIQ